MNKVKSQVRIGKYIAQVGITSRRNVPNVLNQGHVLVNGQVIKDLSYKIDPDLDQVEYMGKAVKMPKFEYYMLNKPRGILSTVSDDRNRPTAVSLIQTDKRIYPVGRLDLNSTGLLLLTNDGELANRLIHPRYKVPKTYHVTVLQPVSNSILEKLSRGVMLEDGMTKRAEVSLIPTISTGGKFVMSITIYEGRKRQIRRMCEALHLEVLSLHRIKVGILELGFLKGGKYRELTHEEIKNLWNQVNK